MYWRAGRRLPSTSGRWPLEEASPLRWNFPHRRRIQQATAPPESRPADELKLSASRDHSHAFHTSRPCMHPFQGGRHRAGYPRTTPASPPRLKRDEGMAFRLLWPYPRDFAVDPKARPIAMLASSAPTLASVRHFPRVMMDPVRSSFPSPLYGLSKRMSWAC